MFLKGKKNGPMKQYYGTKPKIGAGPSRAMGKGVIGRMQKKRKNLNLY